MESFERNRRLVGGAVFLASLMVYLKTVAPTVSFWDCGEFITCAHILGVPHPPGAPLHVLIGRLASLLPITDEIAFRVNLVSCFSSAFTVLLGYLILVRLLRSWIETTDLAGQVAVLSGAAVGTLTMGVSSAFWFNSVETEVYSMSMLITLLVVWITLIWMDRADEPGSDRLLLFVAYLYGLGGGIHLQCWLTIPAVLLAALFVVSRDRSPAQYWVWIAVAFAAPFVAMWTDRDWDFPLGRLLGTGMMAAAIYQVASRRASLRNWRFWGMAVLLFGLGASTYGIPIIRSWADPIIDMNNPGDFQNFQDYVLRKQYGQGFTVPRRGDFWAFQMNLLVKYFLQQFPHWLSIEGVFRTATREDGATEKIAFSLLPVAVGVGGALWHARKDWRRFLVMLSLFLIMGVGLVVYLNMPDPEPRERDYIFVGAYIVFALWIGVGAAGIVQWATRRLREKRVTFAAAPVLLGAAMLALPVVTMTRNFHDHDRTGNYLAHDYAHNILQTCEKDAILFTNGDNDTYPLWFMQYVKRVRPDVRIVNLSLIKTDWYVRQLRDLEPKVSVNLSDEAIRNLQAEAWLEPKDVSVAGLTIEANRVPTANYPAMLEGGEVRTIPVVEQSTRLVWRIVEQAAWKRPVYFAITVPESNHAGLTPYFVCEGMAWRLTQQKRPGRWGFDFDLERARRNLVEVYRYGGLNDPSVYNDEVERRLLVNYQFVYDAVALNYQEAGQDDRVVETLGHYAVVMPPGIVPIQAAVRANFSQILRISAGRFAEKGRNPRAAEALELALRIDPDMAVEGLSRAQVLEAIQALKGGGKAAPSLFPKR